jgi:acetyl-CoA C-acetyltransferase
MNSGVFIVEAVRTPVGKYAGTLANYRPDDLAALIIKGLMANVPHFDPMELEDIIFGAANQSGEDNRNVARMAGLLAGLPLHVGGVTVNRLCGSGLDAIGTAFRSIKAGEGSAFVAGGSESMTRAPFVMPKAEGAFGRSPEIYDTTMGWRFTNKALSKIHHPFAMGETAENVAERYKISREAQDQFAVTSQERWAAANEAGKWTDEIVPVAIPQKKCDPLIFKTDEHPRLSTMEALAKLKPAFKEENGTVTAGNASGINDGAAATLVVSEEMVNKYNLKPLARVVATAVSGVDPAYMGIGPVSATQKVLKRAGLTMNDIGLVELNEAFAAQALACMHDLELNPEIVNVNGGSIAIGHPLGASGARITATLLHEMKRRANVQYGLATMCIGVGQGIAVIYEKC